MCRLSGIGRYIHKRHKINIQGLSPHFPVDLFTAVKSECKIQLLWCGSILHPVYTLHIGVNDNVRRMKPPNSYILGVHTFLESLLLSAEGSMLDWVGIFPFRHRPPHSEFPDLILIHHPVFWRMTRKELGMGYAWLGKSVAQVTTPYFETLRSFYKFRSRNVSLWIF